MVWKSVRQLNAWAISKVLNKNSTFQLRRRTYSGEASFDTKVGHNPFGIILCMWIDVLMLHIREIFGLLDNEVYH